MTLNPFLQAIIAEPGDDSLRLIYADWLEEHGDQERAEFIRLQCELARSGGQTRQRQRLHRRSQQLLRQHGEEWAGPLDRLAEGHVGFVRGFPNEVQVEAQTFLDHVADFFDHPLRVIEFRLVGPGHLAAIAACSQLTRLKELRLQGGGLRPGEGATLGRSPFLSGLERLKLWLGLFGTDGLIGLAESLYLSRLCDLDLSGTEVGIAGVEALAASHLLPQLRSLSLTETATADRAIEALARGPLLGQLTSLSLNRNPLGDASAIALAQSPYLQHLEVLFLGNTQITAAGFEALAASSGLSALKELYLGDTSGLAFPPATVRAVAESPHLGALETLSFHWTNLGDEGAQELARARWRRLQTLYLDHCRIGDAGLRALAATPVLGTVRRLWLTENRIGDEGALALAKSPYLTNIEDLDLRGNRISKEVRGIVRGRFGKRTCRLTW